MMSPNRLHFAVVLGGLATIAVVLVGAVAGQHRNQPSSKPSLAGKWVLDGSPEEGPWSPFGSRFTATQTADALTLQMVTVVTFDEGGPATLAMAQPPERRVIKFNAEARETYPLPPVSPGPAMGMGDSVPISSVTRTGWEGETLVITTHTVSRMTAPSQTPPVFETRAVEHLAISLVGNNRLSVERLRVEDPVPWEVDQYVPPETSKTFYTREGSTDSTEWIRLSGEGRVSVPPIEGEVEDVLGKVSQITAECSERAH